MARAVRGNLAIDEKYGIPQEERKPKQSKQTKRKKWKFQMSERRLYLMMIAVFVVVAMVVISRYAAIYDLNLRTAQLEQDIKNLQAENNALKIKVTQLADPESIMKQAELLGLRKLDATEMQTNGKAPVSQKKGELVFNPQ